jgi:hypothetical protein
LKEPFSKSEKTAKHVRKCWKNNKNYSMSDNKKGIGGFLKCDIQFAREYPFKMVGFSDNMQEILKK